MENTEIDHILSDCKNMDLDPKRNDRCYCMSGKKYKKCCLGKSDFSKPKILSLPNFNLLSEIHEDVFELGMEEDDYINAYHAYMTFVFFSFSVEGEDLADLDFLLEKYPDHPFIHIADAVQLLTRRKHDAFAAKVKKNIDKFPTQPINPLLLQYHEYFLYTEKYCNTIDRSSLPPMPADKEIEVREEYFLSEVMLNYAIQICKHICLDYLESAMLIFTCMHDFLENNSEEDGFFEHFLLIEMERILECAVFLKKFKVWAANHTINTQTPIDELLAQAQQKKDSDAAQELEQRKRALEESRNLSKQGLRPLGRVCRENLLQLCQK